MKALEILEPNRARVVERPTPVPAGDEALIKVMACGICGTDAHILRGDYLGDYPVIPGHEFSGIVEKTGRDVRRFKVGDRVAVEPNLSCQNCVRCLNNQENFCENWQGVGVTLPGGMAQYVAVPEPALFDVGSLDFEEAAFVEPLSCVLHGLERLSVRAGDKTAILGAGPIGILLLQVVRLRGAARVDVVEANPARRDFAKNSGADRALESLEGLEADFYDTVVDATGSLAVMERSLDFARPGGKVLWFGVPPTNKKLSIEGFEVFRKGLTILSSYTSVRNSFQAVALLASGRVDARGLIRHRLELEEFERGVEMIERLEEDVMKVLVLPNGRSKAARQGKHGFPNGKAEAWLQHSKE